MRDVSNRTRPITARAAMRGPRIVTRSFLQPYSEFAVSRSKTPFGLANRITFALGLVLAVGMHSEFSQAQIVQYQFATLDSNGNSVSTVSVGSTFTLKAYVADVRAVPEGVFSAYLDVEYDPSLAAADPASIIHFTPYGDALSADFSSPGLIDEAGGLDGLTPTGGGNFELFSVEMQALAPGLLTISANASDEAVHAVTAYGINTGIPASEQVFQSTTVSVVPEPKGRMLVILGGLLALSSRRWRKRVATH